MTRLRLLSAAFLLLLLGTLPASAQTPQNEPPRPLRVSVDIVGLEASDTEAAEGVQRLAVETLTKYRNWVYRPYFSDVDDEKLRELDRGIAAVLKKLQETMPERHVRDASKALDPLFVTVKQDLGEVPFETVSRLYRALAMTKLLAGDLPLAEQYLMVWLNLLPGEGAQVMRSFETYRNGMTAATVHQQEAGTSEVTIVCDPGVAVVVDGKTSGGCPLKLSVTMGDHLVQASKEGYQRFGALRSTQEYGSSWKLELRPLDMLGRYQRLLRELTAMYASAQPPAWQSVEPYLASVAQLKAADIQLLLVVHLVPNGVRLQGGFWTAKGASVWDETVAKDARFLDYMKGRILQVCDTQAVEAVAKEKQADSVRQELDTWHTELRADLEALKENLEKRGVQWRRIGEDQKADVFDQLVADVALLLTDLSRDVDKAGEDSGKLRRTLTDLGERAKALQAKGRSLLAWDVQGALASKRTRDMSGLMEQGRRLTDDARKLLADAASKLEASKKQEFDKRLKALKTKEAGVAKALKADPEGNLASTRTLLYDWFVKAAETYGLLTKL